jgi:hypothetical protein
MGLPGYRVFLFGPAVAKRPAGSSSARLVAFGGCCFPELSYLEHRETLYLGADTYG